MSRIMESAMYASALCRRIEESALVISGRFSPLESTVIC
jgi:hypothetical protein